jgi:hypothetical protein
MKSVFFCLQTHFFCGLIVTLKRGNDMMSKKEKRISEIRAKAEELGAMLDGCLQTKRNKVVNKDGSVHTSPAHYQFQYRGADGKLRWKSVPRQHCSEVRRLIKKGREYRNLEREYAALMNEIALASLGKKNAVR